MNYADQLLQEHSRANLDRVAKLVGDDPSEFAKIIDLMYTAEEPIPHRASWLLMHLARKHPSLVKPYVTKFVSTVMDFKVSGIRRLIISALCTQEIPAKLQGKTVNICFDLILRPNEPVAVKVFSLQLLANICKQHPELKNEIKAAIEDQLPKTTAAFHARAKHVLKKL